MDGGRTMSESSPRVIAAWLECFKLTCWQYLAINTNYFISHSTTLQYNHNIWHDTSSLEWTAKDSPRLPAYVDGRKLENRYVWKDRIIVASTCRCSVQFGCYIAWLWMANCVSVMKNAAFVYLHHILPFDASLENVTLCVRISRKPFLIGWIHSLFGPCQPLLT